MKQSMKNWIEDLKGAREKTALPILAFPAVSLLGVTVGEIVADSELQAEGMRLVAERTRSAAAVSFMDLSVEAECFGAEIHVGDGEVPTVTGRLIHSLEEAEALSVPEVGAARSGLYVEAVRKAKERITDRPVFAGMIGPFSLAARLSDVSEIMMDCYDDPDAVTALLERTTEFLIRYALAYKATGADGVMIAEPVAGMLSPALEEEFSSPYVRRIVEAVQDDGFLVIYHNCGDNTPRMLDSILSIGAAAYHFGNAVDMEEMLRRIPEDTVVMGNVDPAGVLCLGSTEDVRRETERLLALTEQYPNLIVSSGCDIPPRTPWENVDAFFGTVEAYNGRNA